MNTHLFLITAKTNLHVGNEGGSEFSIIDKTIQRDVLTGLPCINSSSLKGAIKEFCMAQKKAKKNGFKDLDIKHIFGSEDEKNESANGNNKTEDGNNDHQKGSAIFYDAKILYLPIQTTDEDDPNLFKYATSNEVIEQMKERIALFYSNPQQQDDSKTNTFENLCNSIRSHFKDGKCVDKIDTFKELCNDDNLPIIARNCLENGESKNLWYEQVLPAETVLYTIIQEEESVLANALNKKIIQIGANATVGYGYCLFTHISPNNN